jgi:hypothetical protein
MYCIIYVDDIIVLCNDKIHIDNFIDLLSQDFTKLHELGDTNRYIGIDIKIDNNNKTIILKQFPYINSILKSSGLNLSELNTKKHIIPMPSYANYKPSTETNVSKSLQEKAGKWRFLADRTRPDILSAVNLLSSMSHHPTEAIYKGEKQLTQYINSTSDLGLELGGDDMEIKLFGYSDASYIAHGDSKSQLGYCFFLNLTSGTICSRTLKASTVSHSSTEAEIKALDEAIRQCVWLRGFLSELYFPQAEPTTIYIDSLSAKTLSEQYKINNNSSHMIMRLNYIHQEIKSGTINLQYIDTTNQVADILTKLLPINAFVKLRTILLKGHKNIKPYHSYKKPQHFPNKKVLFEKIRKKMLQNKKTKFA